MVHQSDNLVTRRAAPSKGAPDCLPVAVIMGSRSDWPTMRPAVEILQHFLIPYRARVVSAHRTPQRLVRFASIANQYYSIIIAGAGGAAHLPGMIASDTLLPVLGVPVETSALKGLDSLLSIVQMPKGIPVGCLAVGSSGAVNAALLAVSILAGRDKGLAKKWCAYRRDLTRSVPRMPVSYPASPSDKR